MKTPTLTVAGAVLLLACRGSNATSALAASPTTASPTAAQVPGSPVPTKTIDPNVVASAISACGAPRVAAEREQVLFVCEHGAAKSVIAATYFNELAKARGLAVRATARGADPQDMPSAPTVAGLGRDGLTPVVDRPIRLEPRDIRASGHVVAFDCGVPAMSAMRATAVCWDDVPTVSDDYPLARDAIRAHVATLVDEAARAGARPSPTP